MAESQEGTATAAPSVIVSGTIAATPWQGGATWAVLQYLLGLRLLGCAVYFVEPIDGSGPPDPDAVRYCEQVMERFGLDGSHCDGRPRANAGD